MKTVLTLEDDIAYCYEFRYRISAFNRDWILSVNRSSELRNCPIQCFQGSLWAVDKEVAYELYDAFENFEPMISLPLEQSDFEISRPLKMVLQEIKIPDNIYFMMNKFLMHTNIPICTLVPTRWEIQNLRFEMECGLEPDFLYFRDREEVARDIILYHKSARPNFTERTAHNSARFLEEISQLSSRADTITVDDVDHYKWNRHEAFSGFMMTYLGHELTRTDMAFKMVFRDPGWSPLGNRTPDLILRDGNKSEIIDFFVSRAETASAAQEKYKKYRPCILELVKRFPDQEVKFSAIGWESTTERVLIYDFSGSMSRTIPVSEIPGMSDFNRAVTNLEATEGYMKADRMLGLLGPNQNNTATREFEANQKKVTKRLLRCGLPDKSLSMKNALDPNRVGNPDYANKDNIESVEAFKRKFSHQMPSWNHSTENSLVNTMVENIRKRRFSKEVEELMNLDDEKVEEYLTESLMNQYKLSRETTQEYPSFMKIPLISNRYRGPHLPAEWIRMMDVILEDGTILLKLPKREPWPTKDACRAGLGLDINQVTDTMDELRALTVSSSISPDPNIALEKSDICSLLLNVEVMAREIILLMDRRYARKSSATHSSFKQFEKFSLLVSAGPKLKGDSQVVVKVFVESDCGPLHNILSKTLSKSQRNFATDDVYETGWFTLQMADLEHYVCLAARWRVILSDYWDKYLVSAPARELNRIKNGYPDFLLTPLMILMEHKRNTSSSAQTSRYVVHSGTSLLTDKIKLVDEIFTNPIRSVTQAAVVWKQAKWLSYILLNKKSISDSYHDNLHNEEVMEALSLPSIHDLDFRVGFGVTMLEIYACNLFNPSHGMTSHREKAMMEKQLNAEEMYVNRIKEERTSLGFEEIMLNKSQFHIYDPGFVRQAMRNYMSTEGSVELVKSAQLHALNTSVNQILQMSRTLVSGPTEFTEFMDSSDTLNKTVLFEAVLEQVSRFKTCDLRKMISEDEYIMAIFSCFSKNQIGGIREILLQAIRTRMHTSFFNSYFEFLCKAHPKEMITKEKDKVRVLSKAQKSFESISKKINDPEEQDYEGAATVVSLNADSSKWSPSMVMTYYMECIEIMPLEEEFKTYMYAFLASYSNKILYLPRTIMEKLNTWSDEMIEADEVMKKVKEHSDSDGKVMLHSGMGQGNLHHPSSFLHCVMDDYSDKLTVLIFKRFGIVIKMVTCISSDDFTKIALIIHSGADFSVVSKSLYLFVECTANFRKLANIHMNWKKSALHSYICEYNSVFIVASQMYVASIKDAYHSVDPVDMTKPATAVKEALSNVKRLMVDGCTVPTIERALIENRRLLKKFYNITREEEEKLCEMLNCDEAYLPFNLGFCPVVACLEVLAYGPEVLMFHSESQQLDSFYERIYSINELSMVDFEEKEKFDWSAQGTVSIEMAIRPDKQIKELQKRTRERFDYDWDLHCSSRALDNGKNSKILSDYFAYLNDYLRRTNRTFAFSSSYRLQSMIRAMQFKSKLTFSADKREKMNLIEVVEKILAITEFTTHHDLFADMTSIMDEHKARPLKLKTMMKRRSRRRQVQDTMTFYRRSHFESVSVEELVRAMFHGDVKTRSKIIDSISDILTRLDMDYDSFCENPLSCVMRKFPKDPLLTFSRILEKYSSTHSSLTMLCLSNFESTNNRKRDMDLLYMHKSSSTHHLVEDGMSEKTSQNRVLGNLLLFGGFRDAARFYSGTFEEGDTVAERALKCVDHLMVVEEHDLKSVEVMDQRIVGEYPKYMLGPAENWNKGSHHYLSSHSYMILTMSENPYLDVYGSFDLTLFIYVKRELMSTIFTHINLMDQNRRAIPILKADVNFDHLVNIVYVQDMPIMNLVYRESATRWSMKIDIPATRGKFNLAQDQHKFIWDDSCTGPQKSFQNLLSRKNNLSLHEIDDLLISLRMSVLDIRFEEDNVTKTDTTALFDLGMYSMYAMDMSVMNAPDPESSAGVHSVALPDLPEVDVRPLARNDPYSTVGPSSFIKVIEEISQLVVAQVHKELDISKSRQGVRNEDWVSLVFSSTMTNLSFNGRQICETLAYLIASSTVNNTLRGSKTIDYSQIRRFSRRSLEGSEVEDVISFRKRTGVDSLLERLNLFSNVEKEDHFPPLVEIEEEKESSVRTAKSAESRRWKAVASWADSDSE